MNQRRRLALIVALMALSALSCTSIGIITDGRRVTRGSGRVVEEMRDVSGINGVDLATLGDLTIEVGDTESLRIEAEENLIPMIETKVRNGILHIQTENNLNLRTTKPIKYYLTVTGLDSIAISSSGDIQAPDLTAERFSIVVASSGDLIMGDLETDMLDVKISSSGTVTIGELTADAIDVDLSSSGDMNIAGGTVDTQEITINSSGRYTAEGLTSDRAEVRLNSSGSARIWVREQLTARLSSSGDLTYRGTPEVDATTSSSGNVIRTGE